MSLVNGGQLLARTLAEAGVTHAFGIHGGHLDALLVAMDEVGITLVDFRHEQAAGFAAEAYSRETGQLGVVFCTSGPGFTNAYTAIANAHLDRTPTLFITSSPPTREVELNVLQGGIDQIAASIPITRWAHRVQTVSRVPDLTSMAIRRAYGPVPGPTVLEVPIDIMFKAIEESAAVPPTAFRVAPSGPSTASVTAAAHVLRESDHPVIVLGAGAAQSPGAEEALGALLSATSIPVVSTAGGTGLIRTDSPYNLGSVADLATANAVGMVTDAVFILGARRGIQLGGRSTAIIPATAKIVHVECDVAEIGRIGDVEVGILSDVAEFCSRLLEQLEAEGAPDYSAWNTSVQSISGVAAGSFDSQPEVDDEGRLHPHHVAKAVWAAVRPGDTLVTDGGEAAGWAVTNAHGDHVGSTISSGPIGGLGMGTGYSIGAQIARPDDVVYAITGDGAMGFNLQEFETMVRLRLPIITVVFNNLGWGMSYHGQDIVFGEGHRVVTDLPDIRYDQIAAGFGCYAERVERLADLGPALERARQSGLPACLDVATSRQYVHPVMAGLAADLDEGATRIPYYEPVPAGEA